MMEQSGAPEHKTDNIPEIDVTLKMIEAGQSCLDDLFDTTIEPFSETGLMCIPGGWAEAVYRAMQKKR